MKNSHTQWKQWIPANSVPNIIKKIRLSAKKFSLPALLRYLLFMLLSKINNWLIKNKKLTVHKTNLKFKKVALKQLFWFENLSRTLDKCNSISLFFWKKSKTSGRGLGFFQATNISSYDQNFPKKGKVLLYYI